MIKSAEVEEIISLINTGINLELLSFELDLPIEQLKSYKDRLELRKLVKSSINNGTIQSAIRSLEDFIKMTDDNIVERVMLLKLRAYAEKTNVSEEELVKFDEERKENGFHRNIDEILDELGVQIPKRKKSNLRKSEKQSRVEEPIMEESTEKAALEVPKDYSATIEKYRTDISKNPKNVLNKRNLLAFAYFKSGRIDEARDELMSLIDQFGSYISYRQLIHLEKSQGNFEDAKLWAYDCLERFPTSIEVRHQLISIAKSEKNVGEVVRQLKNIIAIHPESEKSKEMLEKFQSRDVR